MNIIEIPLNELKPYKNNPRSNESAIPLVVNSIREFGFKVPLVIDKNNEIVTGHTRYEACKRLGYTSVPCVVASDLTKDQIKAFRIADNKVGEVSIWDELKLQTELDTIDLNMGDFGLSKSLFGEDNEEDVGGFDDIELASGFLTPEEQKEVLSQKYNEDYNFRASNILNLAYAQFEGVGEYDIPPIEPVQMDEIGEIRDWIPFDKVTVDKNPEGKAVHFFLRDYIFERVWNTPDKYVEILKRYKCVVAPDFSPYGDMPLITQMWNHYRKHWLARYWQENGIKVIPCVRASTDSRSLKWYLDGEPNGGVVCISNMWTSDKESKDYFLNHEFKTMIEKLHPTKIFAYGNKMEELEGKVEFIPQAAQQRWRNDNGERK